MTTAEFQREFTTHAETPDPLTPFDSADDVVRSYIGTRHATLAQIQELGVGKDGAREVRAKLAKAFIRRWMMLRFPAIDLSFTKRPWWLSVTRDGAGALTLAETTERETSDHVLCLVGKVERFFRSKMSAHSFAFSDTPDFKMPSVKLGNLHSGRRGKDSFRLLDVTLWAAVPAGISPRHVERARLAIAHYNIGVAALYAKGVALADELRDPNSYSSDDKATGRITVFWAPLVTAVTVRAEPPRPKGDPAIVYTVGHQAFLLDFFDTPNEAPIEHLVREFTEGRLV